MYERILNYRSRRHHRNIASGYFREIRDETADRLCAFDENDLDRYEGNKRIRGAVDRLVKSRIAGPLVLPPLCFFSNVDLCLVK